MHIWKTSQHPLLYAHRGASLDFPENSIAAFQHAIEQGADIIETDVHMSSDLRVVIFHDPSGFRMAGVQKEIRQCSLAEIQSWNIGEHFVDREGRKTFADRKVHMPTLEEALETFPRTPFNIDVKQTEPEMLLPLLRIIDQFNASNRVLLTSFYSPILKKLQKLGYLGPMGMGRQEVAKAFFLPKFALRWMSLPGNRAQIPINYGPLQLGNRYQIDRFHRRDIKVDFWVINQPQLAANLLEAGADGIVTDDPKSIAAVMDNFKGQKTQIS